MGGPFIPEPRIRYPGWPGQPRRDRPSPSSYAASIRQMPVPAMPPPMPGGSMGNPMPPLPPMPPGGDIGNVG